MCVPPARARSAGGTGRSARRRRGLFYNRRLLYAPARPRTGAAELLGGPARQGWLVTTIEKPAAATSLTLFSPTTFEEHVGLDQENARPVDMLGGIVTSSERVSPSPGP